MGNRDTAAAWEYHNSTKHSLASLSSNPHHLDWSNQPRAYKVYTHLKALPLPQRMVQLGVPALTAIAGDGSPPDPERIPDRKALTTLLQLSAGVTKWLRISGGRMAFRAAACTGALYHIELYLVCGELPGLEAGVYQFGVHDMALRQLRGGDYRSLLAKAAGGDQAVTGASVTLVYTSTYWRNAWKYQARTYRHCFWDSGTILANTLAVATALSLPARIVLGFLDDEVNLLLDLDSEREVALSLVALGFSPTRPADPAPTMERLNLATAPLSATEVDYPVIRAMHSASSLTTPDEVAVWRDPSKLTPQPAPAGKLVPLSIPPQEELPRDPIEKVIARRGSSRHFGATPISFEALSTVLEVATRRIPADFLNPSTAWLNDTYLVVNAVDGLTSGAYLFRRQQKTLELLRAGEFRQEAGHLDLGQALAADAAVNVYFLADLGSVLERLGNRGYRAAQLEASITAGKMYLASYALGLSATGLTFFDDDVTNFFSPHAQGKSVMFLIALGMPGRGSSSPNH